jgi:hypothetical protein
MRINGWRRIGIVLVSAWLLGSAGLAITEWSKAKDGFFVYLSLPTGTVFKGNEAVLLDGRVIQLNQKLAGEDIKPWDIKWDNEPEVPTIRHLHWFNLILVGLVLPLMVWVVLELLVAVGFWVMCGFFPPK